MKDKLDTIHNEALVLEDIIHINVKVEQSNHSKYVRMNSMCR